MYKFQENETPVETNMLGEPSRNIISIVVRISGLLLLFVGLWVALQVLHEALDLYRHPENIERVAIAIEQGSNLDKSIAPLKESLQGDDDGTEPAPSKQNPEDGFRLSYFVAWVVELLLLLLIARIALAAIKTGGELALYDAQMKKFARELIQASRKDP